MLRATEVVCHMDLLLAIVRCTPSLASSFFENFPHNVEDFTSPSWFSSISLAANLVSSVGNSCSFGSEDVQTRMKCIFPRPFSRSLITKGMLHSDFLVKHGTLRFLFESLRLLDSFLTSWKLCSSHASDQVQASFEQDVMSEVRSFFPDSQVLLTVLIKSLDGTQKLSLKRKAVLDSELNECISGIPTYQIERVTTKTPPLMFKHLHVLMNLLMFSSHEEVKDLAYDLALEAMRSTGAFAKNPSEIGAWFKFLPGFDKIKRPLKVQEAVLSMSSVVISFLCEAVSTVGNNLFKQWDIVRSILSHLKGASIGFSPLTVCILQKCVRLLNSESKRYSLPEKSEISLYICSTLKYLLQTEVDSRSLSCLVQSVLCEVVEGSKDSLCEWRPLRRLLRFSQSLSDNEPFILHSRMTIGVVADTSFANTLDEITEKVKSICPDQDEFAGIVKKFSSALICETTESILKNFASVMAISCDLYETSSSLLQSISFLDENFLGDLLKLSPDLFARGSEVTESRNLCEGTTDSEIDFADHSSEESEEIKSKTALFVEQMPFHALLNAVMRIDMSCLLEFPRISELLLLKVSQPDIQLILNWLFQIRSFYDVQPAPVLCQLSEMCLRLMKQLLTQTSEQDLVSGPCSDKLVVPSAKRKHQVAQTLICHPVMMALLESPLDCDTLPREQNVLSGIDQHILDLLVYTCEQFLFDGRSIVIIKDLVERLLLVFRGKFELCVGSQSFAPLLQHSHLIHALLRFISPVKLLYLSRSMLSKTEEEDLASPYSSMILSLGLDIAGGAFEMLMLYSHQPAAKRGVYDLLWELEDYNYDTNLIEEVYSLACKFSTSMGLVSADTCLLKVVSGLFRGKQSVHPLTMTVSKIVGRTPKDLIIHCINQANRTRAKMLCYLVESSPLHLSVFGHIFCSLLSKQQDDFNLTDDHFIMLLSAVLSYLTSVIAKLKKPGRRCVDITSAYSSVLINCFLQWPKFVSECIFEEKYEEIVLIMIWDMDTIFNASLIGKAVCMFQHHFALTESPTKTDDLLKIFCSMFPHTSEDDMLSYEIKEVDVESVDDLLNASIRVVAKVELSRICLKESSPEMGSNRERLLNALVNCCICIVKRCDGSTKGKEDKCWLLCKSLEDFILRSILKVLEDMCEKLAHLDSVPFLERLMKSVLLYRFEDTKTWKMLREIFCLLSRGKYSYAPYLQLLISHSQFIPTISSISISSSHTGVLSTPVSSILKHLIIPSPSSVRVKSCCLEAPDYAKQLEIVKTLRVLLLKSGKDSGINLKELHFLLLSSYGATMSEIDLELNKLMQPIELIDELNVSETDYLWGKASLKIREGLRFSHDASDCGEADYLQSLVKENLCIDPKICALTVLYFPYQHTAKKCSRYDPAFILRFSEHSLYTGYIEPVEFASLGLLAVAFVSLSSADLEMRKLGYKTLGRFVEALKGCERNMHEKNRLMLLLLFVQNGVDKQWQRISTVSAGFAAETSLILLEPSHEHYGPILDFLKRSNRLRLRGIPLFRHFFLDSSVRSQRLWELRLLCVGLKSEDDAQIYKENSVLEKLMSFFSDPSADDETKGLILQVVRESVKFHTMAEHLDENCGLLSWCSSCISFFTTKPIGDEDSRFVLVLEVIADALASRKVTERLQKDGLEELMETSSRLYRVLGGGLVSVQENGTCVDLILQILSDTLKISQKRERVQPHFTITYEVIFQLFEAVGNCDSPRVEASAERGLDTILMTTPPVDIIYMDVEKLRRFLLWGTSTALKSDLKNRSNPIESDKEQGQEETMVAKFLRWLMGSLILGKLYSEANHLDPKTEILFVFLKKRNLGGSMTKSEHVLGKVILHLQKLVRTNDNVVLLPSVVFALSLMLLGNGLGTSGTESEGGDDYKLIRSLCSRINSPPEAVPDWRWSYYPSSSEPGKMDVLHACQHLLMILSDMLGETPREYQLRECFDMSSVFEWERGLVETSSM
ncbi:hypothetical protein Rs2_36560 [Raphanus sativus]|nr:hypothetical protein Rs2_36560 [Raphanus sativus]